MSRNFNFTPFNYGSSKPKPQQQKTFNYGSVPPPAALTGSRQANKPAKASYTPVESISQHVMASHYGSKKRAYASNEEDYFDDDEQETLEYIPAENSPTAKR